MKLTTPQKYVFARLDMHAVQQRRNDDSWMTLTDPRELT